VCAIVGVVVSWVMMVQQSAQWMAVLLLQALLAAIFHTSNHSSTVRGVDVHALPLLLFHQQQQTRRSRTGTMVNPTRNNSILLLLLSITTTTNGVFCFPTAAPLSMNKRWTSNSRSQMMQVKRTRTTGLSSAATDENGGGGEQQQQSIRRTAATEEEIEVIGSRQLINAPDARAEAAFLARCKTLCSERNLPLDNVKNARDLASVRNSPVRPGRIYRMGRVSDASASDIHLLFGGDNDDSNGGLHIRTLVDLRSPTELKDDPTLLRVDVFRNFTGIVWQEKHGAGGGLMELQPGQGPIKKRFWNRANGHVISPSHPVVYIADGEDDDDDVDVDLAETVMLDPDENCNLPSTMPKSSRRKERYFVSLMNEFKYVKGTVSKLRKRDITAAILKSPGAVFSRRMRASIKKPFLNEINDGGLPMLNELLLRFGAPGIRFVLTLCANPARHPIAFYCTAGKDRTGIIAAIILALCGADAEDVVEDYTLSANVYAEMNDHKAMVGALSQRNLDPKTFLGAPAGVMRDTLLAINATYGSVQGYCTWIGFGPELQEQLRRACMDPTDRQPDTTAAISHDQ
jgi:Tyrosine phosphatase family